MENLTKQLGKRVKELRKHRGYTQESLAQRADISDKYLSEVERGECKVSVEVLNKVASGLHVNLHDLVNFDSANGRPQNEEQLIALIKNASDEELVMLQRVIKAVLL